MATGWGVEKAYEKISKKCFVTVYLADEPTAGYETSWEEHLREIKEGRRELLDVEIVKSYTYEIILEDGSRTTFDYGGDGPLVKGSKARQGVEGTSTRPR